MFLDRSFHTRQQAFDLLEKACQEFEPTDAQFEMAGNRYEAAGEWLSNATDRRLAGAQIYPQGSHSHGTAIKPIGRLEHDVDLICFAPNFPPYEKPSILKQIVGARLRENGNYRPLVEEKLRCWRMNYAGSFHLDITPSIRNPLCFHGGELVPQKNSDQWKPSNPKGYRAKFERRANMRPTLRALNKMAADSVTAGVEAFPEQSARKGILRRTVQISKRHRDLHFVNSNTALAPISIIITTLASRAYEFCVTHREYNDAFEVMIDTIKEMPKFINQHGGFGQPWIVENQTTNGENFAEKWNADPKLALAFFDWHGQIVADIEALIVAHGLDQTALVLGRAFGEKPAKAAMDAMTAQLSKSRAGGSLAAAPTIGLTSRANASVSTGVRHNNFYGA